jgi:hypothetical protein
MMEDQNAQQCQHVAVASSGAGRITVCCECNVAHVELEYMTLRFSPASFRAVAHLLATGEATLEQARQQSLGQDSAPARAAADVARLH